MLALIVIGMGASSTISYIKSRDALKKAIVSEISGVANSTSNVVGTWIDNRTLDIKHWSQLRIVKSSMKESFVGKAVRKSASQMMAELKKEYVFYEDLYAADSSGALIASSNPKAVGKVNVKDRGYFK